MSKGKIAIICLIAWMAIAAAYSRDYENGYNDAWYDRKNPFLYAFNRDYRDGYQEARNEIEQLRPVSDTLREAKYEAGQTMDQLMIMLEAVRRRLQEKGWIPPSGSHRPPNVPQAPGPAVPVISSSFMLIADFNSNIKTNYLGGEFGTWVSNPSDPRAWVQLSFARDDAFRDPAGQAIQLDYGFDRTQPTYGGFWMRLNDANASSYKKLNFYAKGDAAAGYLKKIKVVLKDRISQPSWIEVGGITDQWKKFSIPLSQFHDVKNWTALTELNIFFDTKDSKSDSGRIYLDHFSFSKD